MASIEQKDEESKIDSNYNSLQVVEQQVSSTSRGFKKAPANLEALVTYTDRENII